MWVFMGLGFRALGLLGPFGFRALGLLGPLGLRALGLLGPLGLRALGLLGRRSGLAHSVPTKGRVVIGFYFCWTSRWGARGGEAEGV